MHNNLFYGTATALVTPFHVKRIDFDALERLIDWQIDSGIDALVVLGTTGEPCSLSEAERGAVIECAAAKVAHRVPLIVGAGSNDTRSAIRYAVEAQILGADALLVVTPYYNKTSKNGMIEHFTSIADKSDVPIIMYNVPSRTGVNLEPQTVAELAKHPMLCALKDACSDTAHMTEMACMCGDGLTIYSGNDDYILQAMALGAQGAISVLANIMPKEMHALTANWLKGDVNTCRELQIRLLPMMKCMSAEVNPIPVKAALAMLGRIEEVLRLPLVPLEENKLDMLRQEMKKNGLSV